MYDILIADDEAIIRRGMERTLGQFARFRVRSAENGEEARAIIAASAVDAVILDICMPVMDGLELMQWMEENGHKPVVMILSGYDAFDYARKALQYGAVDYALKPLDAEDVISLGRKLEAILDEKREREREWHRLREEADGQRREDQPSEAATDGGSQPATIAARIGRHIEAHYAEELSVASLAALFKFSPNYLGQLFKQETGATVSEYVSRIRIEQAKRMLRTTDMMVYEVAEAVGFGDQHYFSQVFKKVAGCTPKEYKERPGER